MLVISSPLNKVLRLHRGDGKEITHRDNSAKVAGQRNNLSKTGESATSAVFGGVLIETLESGTGNRAACVAGVEVVKQAINAAVPCISFSRGVLVLLLRVLPWLLLVLLGLLLVLLRLLLVLLGLLLVLGGSSSGQGNKSGERELHCDGCRVINE
jgi:hypothetical protein